MQNVAQKQRYANITSLILLATLIVIWGVNWPVMKVALIDISPLWLATMRMVIAGSCLFIFLLITKSLKIPSRQDLPIILVVSLLQMVVFLSCTNLGLMHVSTGRSVILAYTTPLWVVPIAFFAFKEHISLLKACGMVLGLAGVFLLFNPMSLDWSSWDILLSHALLLIAALAWAVCIVYARNAKWHLTTLQLMPWQMLIASIILAIFSYFYEPASQINWSPRLIGLLCYIGPVATALGYWLILEVSRRLPSVTTSLCMLGVPVFGVLAAYLFLGEPIQADMITSMVLITLGLVFVVRATAKQAPSS